jgi:hypothetical protein
MYLTQIQMCKISNCAGNMDDVRHILGDIKLTEVYN